MDILGLDKIKHLEENNIVEVQGLEMIRSETVNITGLDSIRHADGQNLPMMSSFAVKLIELVNAARDLDWEQKEFGARQHGYDFDPVIPLSEVRDYESRHGITLPRGYVDYLTQAGNGGAGPGYGVFSLERLEDEAYYLHKNTSCPYSEVRSQPDYSTLSYTVPEKAPMITSLISPAGWDSWYNRLMELKNDEANDRYDEMYKEAYNGMIPIIDEGYGTGYLLACAGDLCGQVVFYRRDMDMPQPLSLSFEAFMLDYFKSIVRKYENR